MKTILQWLLDNELSIRWTAVTFIAGIVFAVAMNAYDRSRFKQVNNYEINCTEYYILQKGDVRLVIVRDSIDAVQNVQRYKLVNKK